MPRRPLRLVGHGHRHKLPRLDIGYALRSRRQFRFGLLFRLLFRLLLRSPLGLLDLRPLLGDLLAPPVRDVVPWHDRNIEELHVGKLAQFSPHHRRAHLAQRSSLDLSDTISTKRKFLAYSIERLGVIVSSNAR